MSGLLIRKKFFVNERPVRVDLVELPENRQGIFHRVVVKCAQKTAKRFHGITNNI